VSKTPRDAGRDDALRDDSSLPWDQFLGGAADHSAEAVSDSPSGGRANASVADPQSDESDSRTNSSGEPTVTTGVGSWPQTVVPSSRRAAREAAGSRGTRSSRRAQLDYVPVERTSRKGAWGCLAVLVVFLALMAVGAFALQGPLSQLMAASQGPADYAGTGEKEHVIMVHEGNTGEDVANTLVEQDVVKSFPAFYSLLLKETPAPVFQPGAYQLKTKMSARAALDALLDPANKLEQTVVIPEGTVAVDVLQSLAEGTDIPLADIQAAAADLATYGLPAEATSLEGFLFPATYTFTPGTSAHDALKTMVDRQFTALGDAGVAPEQRWTTIVMASLIQREAGLADDYYKVSRVFSNRLDPNLWPTGLLQSDATVAYGTGNTHRVTTSDAERADPNNPYNTYVHPGLPVGPISNPGDLAIDAALHPADGPWLFFVTWNLDTGETIFSTTEDEHQAAVNTWLNWMAEHPEYG
jgi:UPF0755 protein